MATEKGLDVALEPFEQAVYTHICHGLTDNEIAQQLNNQWNIATIGRAARRVLNKLEKTRVELVLDYLEGNCPSDQLPLAAFEQAVAHIALLCPQERRVLDTYLKQWQEFRTQGPASPQPSRESVARVLGCTPASVSASLKRAHGRVFGAGRVCSWKLIQSYYMAMLYPRAAKIPDTQIFPFPAGLSRLERRTYRALCYGFDNYEIAKVLGCKYAAASQLVATVAKELGWSRIEIALRFTADHCPHDLLPVGAYDEAVEKINQLDDRQRNILHEYLMQWRAYIALPASERLEAPSLKGVSAVFGLKSQTVSLLFGLVAERLGIAHNVIGAPRWCKFIRWYDMALRRAEM